MPNYFPEIDPVTGEFLSPLVTDAIDARAAAAGSVGHNHDDRYYTEAEADGRFVRTVNGAGPDGSGNVAVEAGSAVDDLDDVPDSATRVAMTTAERTKLAGVADGAEANVQADWNAATGDAQILNKPALGTAAAADAGDFATAAQGAKADSASQPGHTHTLDQATDTATRLAMTPAERAKLGGVADGAEVNVNADWNATSGDAQILNKPAVIADGATQTEARGKIGAISQTAVDAIATAVNVASLGVTPNTGAPVSAALHAALVQCVAANRPAFIPAGEYIVGQFLSAPNNWKCLPLPDGLVLHLAPGVIFKLAPNSPTWSRVIVPGNNVTIHGELVIDGSAETITAGNEHMAGLFINAVTDVTIDSVNSYNCYGDNVQITGGSGAHSDRIRIGKIRARKAGRKNLVLEAVNADIGEAFLDNTEGGGGCLDVEPFSMGTKTFVCRIGRLETTGTNDFTTGTTKALAAQFRLDIGTLIQHGGTFIAYAMTINIDHAYFGAAFGGMSCLYATQLTIGTVAYKGTARLLDAQTPGAGQPEINWGKVSVIGDPEVTPATSLIYWRGCHIAIGELEVSNFNNEIVKSQHTATGSLRLGTLRSINSGAPGAAIVRLESFSTNRSSTRVDNLVVTDSRATKSTDIFRFVQADEAAHLTVGSVHNPDGLYVGYNSGSARRWWKTAGAVTGPGLYVVTGHPDGLPAQQGSMALRTDATAAVAYIKDPGGGTTWTQIGSAQPINAQTGTAYTLVAADAGKLVTATNAAAVTVTVPANVFTEGQQVDLVNLGTGQVTIAAGAGMTVNGTPTLQTRAQYSALTIKCLSATSAVVVGDLAAS